MRRKVKRSPSTDICAGWLRRTTRQSAAEAAPEKRIGTRSATKDTIRPLISDAPIEIPGGNVNEHG